MTFALNVHINVSKLYIHLYRFRIKKCNKLIFTIISLDENNEKNEKNDEIMKNKNESITISSIFLNYIKSNILDLPLTYGQVLGE
jgi:amino acid permease